MSNGRRRPLPKKGGHLTDGKQRDPTNPESSLVPLAWECCVLPFCPNQKPPSGHSCANSYLTSCTPLVLCVLPLLHFLAVVSTCQVDSRSVVRSAPTIHLSWYVADSGEPCLSGNGPRRALLRRWTQKCWVDPVGMLHKRHFNWMNPILSEACRRMCPKPSASWVRILSAGRFLSLLSMGENSK